MSTASTIVAINHAKGKRGFHISKTKRKEGLKAIQKRIDEIGLDTESPKIQITGSNKRKATVGTDSAQESSIDRYEIIWDGLLNFCIEIKDYDSAMIVARDICPNDPLPVSVDTAISYLRFRVLEKGTDVLHHKTNLPIVDSAGNPMKSLGDWQSEPGVKLFATALAKVHAHYKTTSGKYYLDECEDCHKLFVEHNITTGCRRHINSAQIWRKGCPTEDSTFKNKHKQMKIYARTQYTARHTIAFLPGELRDLRFYLLSSNSLYNMMIWTIIIVGVKEFLRVDEVLAMTVEDFLEDYFAVSADNVQCLAASVQGKTDIEKENLAIWDDAECPDFSPTRALLIWLAVSGIKSGKLFPCEDALAARVTMPQHQLPYDTLLDEFKFLCVSVLKKDMSSETMKRLIIGTHMLRRTAYFLAFWGFNRNYNHQDFSHADRANILQSARHKDPKSCATYLGDAGTLLNLLKKVDKNDTRHRVSEWQPIHIKTLDTFAALNIPSKRYIKPLVELADWYVFDKLNVPNDGTFGRLTFLQIHERACAFVPDLASDEKLHKLLEQYLPAVALPTALSLINKSAQNQVIQAVKHNTEIQQAAVATAILPAAATPSPSSSEQNKCRKYNPEEIVQCSKDYQKEANKLSVSKSKAQLLDLLQKAVQEILEQKQHGKVLQDPLKTWAYKAGKVVKCLQACHSNNKESFLQANSSFTVSRFKCSHGEAHSFSFDPNSV